MVQAPRLPSLFVIRVVRASRLPFPVNRPEERASGDKRSTVGRGPFGWPPGVMPAPLGAPKSVGQKKTESWKMSVRSGFPEEYKEWALFKGDHPYHHQTTGSV